MYLARLDNAANRQHVTTAHLYLRNRMGIHIGPKQLHSAGIENCMIAAEHPTNVGSPKNNIQAKMSAIDHWISMGRNLRTSKIPDDIGIHWKWMLYVQQGYFVITACLPALSPGQSR